MRGDLEGLIRPDGSVRVPADVADDVLRWLVRGLTAQVRRDGGEVGPQARRVLHALYEAAQRHEFERSGDVASVPGSPANVEVTVAEAAELMECSPQWVRHLLGAGRITGRRPNRRLWLVDLASLDDYRRGGHAEGQDRRAG